MKQGWVAILGLAVLSCSSAPQNQVWVRDLLPRSVMARRPPFDAADPVASAGGVDYRTKLDPDSTDCQSFEDLFRVIRLEELERCLKTFSERQSFVYRLIPRSAALFETRSGLEKCSCLETALPEIPVPREIFFESWPDTRDPRSVECLSSSLDLDADVLWGFKWGWKAKVGVNLQVPLTEIPTQYVGWVRWLSWLVVSF